MSTHFLMLYKRMVCLATYDPYAQIAINHTLDRKILLTGWKKSRVLPTQN